MAKKEITIEDLLKSVKLATENLKNAQAVLSAAQEKEAAETDEKKKAKLTDAVKEAQDEVTTAQEELDEANADLKSFQNEQAAQTATGNFQKKADQYLKLYPKTDEIYITSDGSVFLEKNPAANHQRGVDKTKSYETYKRS